MVLKYQNSIRTKSSSKLFWHGLAKTPTIVIIDDDKFLINSVYRILLEKKGYRVLTAASGALALGLLHKEKLPPDLILVDVSMPEMSGKHFLLKLKIELPQIFFNSKIVGISSFALTSTHFTEMKAIAFDCRQKPFDMSGFLKIVSDYVEAPMKRLETKFKTNQDNAKMPVRLRK